MKVAVWGSVNLDIVYEVQEVVRVGQTIASTDRKTFSGGKGANQAVALARSVSRGGRITVHMCGLMGSDGDSVRRELHQNGVDCRQLRVDAQGQTGQAIIQVQRTNGDNAIVLFPGCNRQLTREHVDAAFGPGTLFTKGDWLVMQNEVSAGAEAMRAAHLLGMHIAFNPAPMSGTLTREYPLELVDLLMVNEGESVDLARQLGEELAGGGAEQLIRKAYPQLSGVVVTLGERGVRALLRVEGEMQKFEAPARKIQVVDTTGAGDTFVGYLVTALMCVGLDKMTSQDVVDALRRATVASSLACQKAGAMQSIPSENEVDQIID